MTEQQTSDAALREDGRPSSAVGGLRRHAARGTIINGTYLLALNALVAVRGIVGAGFMSASDFGIWGLLTLALLSVLWLRDVGINDAYVQQSDDDQQRAFQQAFSLSMFSMAASFVAMLGFIVVFALISGRTELLAPGAVLATSLLAAGLQFPIWAFYRTMDFRRQRLTQAVEPLVGFCVTVALLLAGVDYWALVIGVVSGSWAAAVVAEAVSPYHLALRFERAAARHYINFSWPIVFAYGTTVATIQITYLVGGQHLGLAGLGAIALAGTIATFANKADGVITETLYPAICAVSDRQDLLAESFVKSNRLALLWAMPFGCGVALFVDDLVRFVLGEKWQFAAVYLATVCLASGLNHIGFNWHAFYRARGETRPLAMAGTAAMVTALGLQLPLLFTLGLNGLALGIALGLVPSLLVRAYYVRRMFPGLTVARHIARSMAPSVAAAGAVLLVRAADGDVPRLVAAVAELAIFIAVSVGASCVTEGSLLREAAGYLRRAPQPSVAPIAAYPDAAVPLPETLP